MELILISLAPFVAVGLLACIPLAYMAWIAKGESDVNGDIEKDSGENTMNINAAFKSDYVRAADLAKPALATIKNVSIERLGQGKDAEDKPVVHFHEDIGALVLNKTNASLITKLYGAETDSWAGKQIVLYSTPVQFGADMVDAVRVRAPKGAPATPPAPAPAALAGPEDPEEVPF